LAWMRVDRVNDGIDDAAINQKMLAKALACDVLWGTHRGGERS